MSKKPLPLRGIDWLKIGGAILLALASNPKVVDGAADALRARRMVKPTRRILFFETQNVQHALGRAHDVDAVTRQTACRILEYGGDLGELKLHYCAVCRKELGYERVWMEFVWPDGAEHYIEDHSVWTSDLDDLLAAKLDRRV